MVLFWNSRTLRAIQIKGTPAPIAARHLALVHAAIYDASNAVSRSHGPFLVDVRPTAATSSDAAVASAASEVLVSLYPAQGDDLRQTLTDSLARLPDGPAKDSGVSLGRFVGQEVVRKRAGDGADHSVGLTLANRPGVWRPTPPDYRPPLVPHWGKVSFFALPSADCMQPPAPPALTSAEYAAALKEVRELGSKDKSTRTADQTEIARFWEGGAGTSTPPGHWNRIAQTLARDRKLSEAETARLFALLNAALADAAVCCWDCKYKYALWRPIQAIREADADRDPAWEPLLATPPFPTYTSGHSTFSGAAETVLAGYFGTDRVPFTIGSEGLPGVSRSFAGFRSAAEEAGRSRIYGGIHFEFDNSAGLTLGREIGNHVTRCFLPPVAPEQPVAQRSVP